MVSLFNIRFRNEFEVSDIWNGTDVKGGRAEQWKTDEKDRVVDRRGEKGEKEGWGESKKKQIISDNFISKRQTNMTEKKYPNQHLGEWIS